MNRSLGPRYHLDPDTVADYLRHQQLPDGMSKEEIDDVIVQMAQLAYRNAVMNHSGPLPGPTAVVRGTTMGRRVLNLINNFFGPPRQHTIRLRSARPGAVTAMVPLAEASRAEAAEAVNTSNFYFCFISYARENQEFAQRLHADLQKNGVRCWFAPEQLQIGERFADKIDRSIRLHDKVLLVLSAAAISSQWVEREVNSALEEEEKRVTETGKSSTKPVVLFPITIDKAIYGTDSSWARHVRNTRYIGDFSAWRDQVSCDAALSRVLEDLTNT